jgi:hypothetical protein
MGDGGRGLAFWFCAPDHPDRRYVPADQRVRRVNLTYPADGRDSAKSGMGRDITAA